MLYPDTRGMGGVSDGVVLKIFSILEKRFGGSREMVA